MAHRARLLSLIRLLRNSCAAGAPAAAELLTADVPCRALRLACHLASTPVASGCADSQQQLLAASLQLLANACAASPAAAIAVWQGWFPESLTQLLADTQGTQRSAP